MATKRPKPYVWASWITKLLAGESQCAWAAWFRAHHRYDKLPRDADLAAWTSGHTAMVGERSRVLTEDGSPTEKGKIVSPSKAEVVQSCPGNRTSSL